MILGMQWLRTMGYMGVDWSGLTMTFEKEGKKLSIKGDASLTKAEVSLKMLHKSWTETDQGFLVEIEEMNREEAREIIGAEEHHMDEGTPRDIRELIDEYRDIFELPGGLSPKREIDHDINSNRPTCAQTTTGTEGNTTLVSEVVGKIIGI